MTVWMFRSARKSRFPGIFDCRPGMRAIPGDVGGILYDYWFAQTYGDAQLWQAVIRASKWQSLISTSASDPPIPIYPRGVLQPATLMVLIEWAVGKKRSSV